jgi:hypothetical protein
MQKIIDYAVNDLINKIDSSKDNQSIAYQFILEEFEAGQNSLKFVQHSIKTSGIDKTKYNGAKAKNIFYRNEVDFLQNYLDIGMEQLAKQIDIEIAIIVRISIVLNIMAHYKIGRYNSKFNKQKRKEVDLFKIVIPETKLHPHFKAINHESKKTIRRVLDKWAKGFIDRDKKFNKEFQKTFNSSFWELYLFQSFKELNYIVDFTKASPDFTVYTPYDTLCIEATITEQAKDDAPEWTQEALKQRKEKIFDEFINYTSVRILNAIKSKHKKYLDDYSKLEHVQNNPFIIAIAPFDQKLTFNQNNIAINNILYGQMIKHNLFEKDKEPKCEIVYNSTIEKNEKTSLDIGIFKTDKYKEVSAIIFSTMATISKAITQSDLKCKVRLSRFHEEKGLLRDIIKNEECNESHLEGLQIYHNPFAINPLDEREFNKYEITHYWYDKDLHMVGTNQNNNTIISRTIHEY